MDKVVSFLSCDCSNVNDVKIVQVDNIIIKKLNHIFELEKILPDDELLYLADKYLKMILKECKKYDTKVYYGVTYQKEFFYMAVVDVPSCFVKTIYDVLDSNEDYKKLSLAIAYIKNDKLLGMTFDY